MPMIAKRLLILAVLLSAGWLLGRLTLRALGNLLLGGALFGGNFL